MGLPASFGPGVWKVANTGHENHLFDFTRGDPGHTPDEVYAAMTGDAGPPAFVHLMGAVGILAPGRSAYVDLRRIPAGSYAAFCPWTGTASWNVSMPGQRRRPTRTMPDRHGSAE